MNHVMRITGLMWLGAMLALSLLLPVARATEFMQEYKFRIVDGADVTVVGIGVPKDLDTNFPAPISVANINVAQADADQLVKGVKLLDRWSGIFRGSLFHRLSGSVGVIVRLIKDPDHKSLAELHAVLGKDLERQSKTYRDSEVMVSEIAMVGGYRYSHYRIGAHERTGFDEQYVLPLHDGYYLRFVFIYVSNNYKPDINIANLAQAHSDIDQAIQSVSVSESNQ